MGGSWHVLSRGKVANQGPLGFGGKPRWSGRECVKASETVHKGRVRGQESKMAEEVGVLCKMSGVITQATSEVRPEG